MKKASVSVIIPCYNCATTIDRAIQSILKQTLLPSEVILIDDASSDDSATRKKIMKLQKDHPVDFIKVIELHDNGGAGVARNKGWDLAKGDYIAFLDADDSWHSQKLEIQYNIMKSNPKLDLTSHKCIIKSEDEDVKLQDGCIEFVEISTFNMLLSNQIATKSVVMKRNLPFRFEKEKRYSEDYHLWLKIIANSYNVSYIPLSLAYSYKEVYGESGLSSHLWKMEKNEIGSLLDIYSLGLLNKRHIAIAIPWSFMKFIKRIIITKIKSSKRKKN